MTTRPNDQVRSPCDSALGKPEAWLRAQKEAFEASVGGAPLDVSLGVLMRTAIEQTGGDARCAFYLADGNLHELHQLIGMPNSYATCVDGFKIGPNSLACGLAVYTKRSVITPDIFKDPRWQSCVGLADRYDFRGCWSFPLETLSGKVIGTFAMYFKTPREATARDLDSAALLARAAAMIIERHQEGQESTRAEAALRESEESLRHVNELLEDRVRERTAELEAEVQERRAAEERIKNLLRQLVNAEEEQRRRIARELHDTLGQQLAALHVNIEVLKSRADGDRSVHETIARMRETFDHLNSTIDFLAWELRPPTLDLLGLDAAFESYVREWSQQFGIEGVYQGVGVHGLRWPSEAETNLYRIFQEALLNVHKHAAASRVSVLFERRDGHAVLIVEDDGDGYDTENATEGRGMGLTNMRERAALIGGTVEIESTVGQGTTVFARVPMRA